MPVYDGNNWEVRIATTQAGLPSATAIPFVRSWSYDRDPGIEQVPKGMGYGRGKEVHETLTEITGSFEKGYCDTLLAVQSPWTPTLSPFGEIAIMEDTAWWLEFKNKVSLKKLQFGGVHGHYKHDHAEDDFGTETWDWAAESITSLDIPAFLRQVSGGLIEFGGSSPNSYSGAEAGIVRSRRRFSSSSRTKRPTHTNHHTSSAATEEEEAGENLHSAQKKGGSS